MVKHALTFFLAVILVLSATEVFSHCEVPCGIYGDKARVEEIHEHLTTIEKAMDQIKTLSAAEEKNYNQIVRWVTTKEDHANKIQDIIYQYFMAQRVKPVPAVADEAVYQKYINELTLLHSMLVSAMKAKQTLDAGHVKSIHDDLELFSQSYFNEARDKGKSKIKIWKKDSEKKSQ